MNKWMLLVFSLITVYALIEAISWFFMMLKAPVKKAEDIMGITAAGLSQHQREHRSIRIKSINFLFPVLVLLFIAFVVVMSTIRAFVADAT